MENITGNTASDSNNSITNGSNGGGSNNGAPNSGNSFQAKLPPIDFKAIIDRLQFIVLNPKSCWDTLKSEAISIPDIYRKYLFVLAAIPALAGFIKFAIIGVSIPYLGTWRAPFFGQLISCVVQYGTSLVMLYVAAIVVEKVAPHLEAKVDFSSAFRLIAYSTMPMYALGILQLLPWIGIVGILGAVFGIYLYVQGTPKMVEVAETNKLKFIIGSIVAIAVVNIVLGLLIYTVTPTPAGAYQTTPTTGQPGQVDINKLQQGMQELQKAISK